MAIYRMKAASSTKAKLCGIHPSVSPFEEPAPIRRGGIKGGCKNSAKIRVIRVIRVLVFLFLVFPNIFYAGDNPENHRQNSSITIGENFRIYPGNITQTETFITRHPSNPGILFASANTINLSSGFISEGIYVTTDGGSTWFGSDTCKSALINLHNGDPGIAIDKDGRFLLIRLGIIAGLFSHHSTDNGLTWSAQKTVATNDQDRATLVSDGNPASSFYGRSYAVWVRFSPPYPAFFSYTDDGAQNWSIPAQINNPIQRCQGGEVALGPNGSVNVCWAAVISGSPFTEDFVGFSSSTNGGAAWNVTENVFDMNGIAGTMPEKANIRVNGLPRIDVDKTGGPRNGWIYIVTTERDLAPAGSDPDIILHRSTDSGQSWSPGIRVNRDAPDNGKIQYFPAIHVDENGGVNIIYYDDRATTSDSAGVFLSRSTDGGNTWDDYEISDHNFKPQPIGGLGQGYQGDNIGLTSANNTLWPVWMDNSSGIYQIWTCPVEIPIVGIDPEEKTLPAAFELKQNYPNPFNPSTIIEYNLLKKDFVIVKIFDIYGRIITTLVNEDQPAGNYKIVFNTNHLPSRNVLSSGIYFYQLSTASGFSEVKPMLLLK